jgi:outer membrane receptor protein involved in Fe transport
VDTAGIQWLTADILNLYGTFSMGNRAPNLQETTVLGDTGSKFEIPNPNLKPETSNTFELGTRFNIKPIELGFAWFYSLLDDIIDEAPATWLGLDTIDGAPVIQRVNSDSAVYNGIEGSLAAHFYNFTFLTNITWMKGDITSGDKTNPARRIPPLFGLSSLKYDDPGHRFFAEFFVDWAGPQTRLHPSDEKDLRICETSYLSGKTYKETGQKCPGSPGWYTLNIRGGIRLTPNAMLSMSAANLTDNKYKRHGSGFYAPGFNAKGTLRISF